MKPLAIYQIGDRVFDLRINRAGTVTGIQRSFLSPRFVTYSVRLDDGRIVAARDDDLAPNEGGQVVGFRPRRPCQTVRAVSDGPGAA